MKNIKLSSKMIISFAILTIFTIGIVIGGIFGITQLNKGVNMLYENVVVGMEHINRIKTNILEQRVLVQQYADNIVDTAKAAEIKEQIQTNLETNEKNITDYQENVVQSTTVVANGLLDEATLQELLDMVDQFVVLNDDYFSTTLSAIIAKQSVTTEEISSFLNSENSQQMMDLLNIASNFYIAQSEKSVTLTDSSSRMINILIYVALAIYLLVAGLLIVLIPRSIAKPIRHLIKVADAVAVGDMSKKVNAKYSSRKDEVGMLAEALNRMQLEINRQIELLEALARADLTITPQLRSEQDTMGKALISLSESLNQVVSDVSFSTENVTKEAKLVASQSQELAQGTTEQAASVEELSSAFFQISLNTKESANLASKAASVSDEVKNKAIEGSQMMSQMIQAVQDAATASKSIDKIIKAIEEISFQTNILALNAAVEAAHAGQNGSGFAVVAAEVRSLASKSAASAKETSILIANTLDKVNLGAEIAGETSDSFQKIVDGVMESTKMITDIAKFSEEQASAIDQINSGIGQVAQVIHINSSAAEECAAAAEKLSSQAKAMEHLLSRFRRKDSDNNIIHGRRDDDAMSSPSAKIIADPDFKIDLSPTMPPSIPNDDFGKY